jgi:hypothetical protein
MIYRLLLIIQFPFSMAYAQERHIGILIEPSITQPINSSDIIDSINGEQFFQKYECRNKGGISFGLNFHSYFTDSQKWAISLGAQYSYRSFENNTYLVRYTTSNSGIDSIHLNGWQRIEQREIETPILLNRTFYFRNEKIKFGFGLGLSPAFKIKDKYTLTFSDKPEFNEVFYPIYNTVIDRLYILSSLSFTYTQGRVEYFISPTSRIQVKYVPPGSSGSKPSPTLSLSLRFGIALLLYNPRD